MSPPAAPVPAAIAKPCIFIFPPVEYAYYATFVVVMPLRMDQHGRPFITVNLDGKPLKALIDTGATESTMSLDAAKSLFGFQPGNAAVEKSMPTTDVHARALDTYRHQFKALDVGGITFSNPWLTLVDTEWQPGQDLILGMYHLRKMHLYFAFGEHKLYATVAPQDAEEPIDPQASIEWQRCLAGGQENADIAISGCTVIIAAGSEAKSHLAIAYAKRGAAALRKGDTTSAGRDFDQALKTDPDSADVTIVHAMALAEHGEHPAAIREFDAALKAAPGRIDALIGRASAEIATGATAAAAGDLRQAAAQNWSFGRTTEGANGTAKSINGQILSLAKSLTAAQPGLVDAHIALSDVYASEGDRDHAIPELDLALVANPNSADALQRRSARYQERGDLERALADLDQLVRLKPADAAVLNQRCWVRAIAGRLDAALPDCDASLKLSPSAQAFDSRGFVQLKAGRNAQAIDDYSAALRLEPKFASALYGRGQARKAAGDADGAAADIAAAKQLRADIEQRFGK